jgi:hypothetical protein
MIIPTVGRIVHFYPHDKAGLGHELLAQPLAAQIAYVHANDLVNLSVTLPSGEHTAAKNVKLWDGEGDSPTGVSYATWMDYQKKQAARDGFADSEHANKANVYGTPQNGEALINSGTPMPLSAPTTRENIIKAAKETGSPLDQQKAIS